MHVLVTGATGWVGSAVTENLIAAGHRVTGLARSKEKAAALAATRASAVRSGGKAAGSSGQAAVRGGQLMEDREVVVAIEWEKTPR